MTAEDSPMRQASLELAQLRKRVSELEAALGDHKQTEEALRESEQRLHIMFESVTDGITATDLEGNITEANAATLRLHGYDSREELIGKAAFELLAKREHERALQNMKKTLEEDSVSGLEYIALKKDGIEFSIELNSSVVRDKHGNPKGFIATTKDITARRHAEDALKESRLRFRAIFDNAMDGMLVADIEDKSFYMANRMMCQMLGYSQEEFEKMGIVDIHPEKDMPYVIQEFDKQAKGENTLAKNIPMKRKDGSVLFADVNSAPIILGRREYLLGVFRDTTERKRTEEELERYATKLVASNKELERLMEEVRALSLNDELTGLYNRRGFLTLAKQQIKTSNRTGKGVLLGLIDLDDLKKINDAHGHHEGDLALAEIATTLKNTFRDSDIIGRIGGDEFVVLWIESPESSSDILAARLRENLRTQNSRGRRPYELSISMGIARYNPESPCTVDELMAQADRLMYKQKQAK